MRRSMVLLVLCLFPLAVSAGENLVVNGDFEQGLAGWHDFWSRTPGGRAAVDETVRHGGKKAVRIEHSGAQDWSFNQRREIEVKPGQMYELSGWVRLEGEGSTTLCVIPRDAKGRTNDWSFGGQTSKATGDWRLLRSRFIVPAEIKSLVPRLIGQGPAKVWADDIALTLVGSLDALRAKDLPKTLQAATAGVEATFDVDRGTLAVVDRRTGQRWEQRPGGDMVMIGARRVAGGFDLRMLEPAAMMQIDAKIRLDEHQPEISVELSATGELAKPLAFPGPFVTGKGTMLIMPVNEGISYPVDDEGLSPMQYHLYGGHGLCMGWYGVTDGRRGLLTIVETPDDAAVRIPRREGFLCAAPEWQPQKGQFGPARRLRYVLLDDGGYVAMCKRYREHAKQAGLVKTMAEKRKANPNVDLLIGAVNVWCFREEPVSTCRELQAAGIRRILWSQGTGPKTLDELNRMGVLTSRYDIYQDAMNPAEYPNLRGVHSDWTSDAWPHDLAIDAHGQWIRGWEVESKDGRRIPCGVLCDRQAVEYAKRRIPPELKTHPYRCRFIDTTTAAPWRECYSPDHPMTRTESRQFKMDLLRYVSEDCGLVTGCETGHEASVPYLHYFEGMMSLGPYRVRDAGRRMGDILDEVPERLAKFQTGHFYRLPLWELVYHDCVVAQWYWGDYNNKLPSVWDRRDLWNALYGSGPMFMFNRKFWQENRERFVRSYKTATPVARATGYSEMLSHRWLTADHAVQESQFAGGVTVTVNFGDKPYTLADGTVLAPLGERVSGIGGDN